MPDLFTGKVAVVTGGSAGIGRAAAHLFAKHDARVIVSDISEAAGEAVADEIRGAGGEARFVRCDVSDRASVAALIAAVVATYDRLDCAFNNAGVCLDEGEDWNDDVFDRTFDINVKGVMSCMKAQIPHMLNNGGGTIVNTASTNGIVSSGMPSLPAYTGSKHAVIGLTKTAALTYARRGIRVNALCPGVTFTPMVEQVVALGPAVKETLDNYSPMGRMARPEEMAEAAIWLCSDKSSFVNGHALVVDGGAVIQ
jgi:NAD(P)-dependent dehydrogenase (short-subunit alcohol dehydrogenase family)